MKDGFIFGAAYYEEYLPTDRVERDLQLMEQAGLNTIRIGESTWSLEEPREGEFDFSHVTRVIEAAAKHRINVIVGTPTYAIPPWLAKKIPSILDGNLYGPRQNFDITHPSYRSYAERIIREMVRRTAEYPNVIGYQLDNETKHYGVHSRRVISGFRKWLRERFGTPEAVNAAYNLAHWSNSVDSFDDLPDPTGAVNPGYRCAFEEYRRSLVTEFLLWQSELVTELKRPDQFLTHNFDYNWVFTEPGGKLGGFSCGLQQEVNHYDAAKALTLVGTDIYCPAGESLTGREIAFGGDEMRSLGKGEYLVLESQSQCFPGFLPYPGQLRLMALSHIASGANGLMYWPWNSLPGGCESYWKGILSHDGEPGETYREVRQIGKELQRLAPELCGLKKQCKVAMIVSPESLHALENMPTEPGLSYNDVLMEFYTALYELNVECDLLYDRETDWSGYRLLIFPQLYCASEALISRVRDYVSGGGCVLASFRSFFADENTRIYPDRQPHGLTEVFGMHYSRFTLSPEGRWMELLEPDRAAVAGRYDHKCWGGAAAATRSRFGKGHAWYLGTHLDRADLRDFLIRVCDTAELTLPAQRFPVVLRSAEAPDGTPVLFVFNYSGEPRTIPCPAQGRDILTGEIYAMGTPIPLPEWGAAILK